MFFGQKDGLQCFVVSELLHDLNFPIKMSIVPTARESDGLAMSSRNVYLNPEQRKAAPCLYQALQNGTSKSNTRAAMEALIRKLLSKQPLFDIQYVSIANAKTAEELPVDELIPSHKFDVLVSCAVKIGPTRLLDNILISRTVN